MDNTKRKQYMARLDAVLETLQLSLSSGQPGNLPQEKVNGRLATLIGDIRETYRWFGPSIDEHGRMDYFQDIRPGEKSGLPGTFDLIALHKLKSDAPAILSKMPDYHALASTLQSMLMSDMIPVDDVAARTQIIADDASRRHYLEHLVDADILRWKSSDIRIKAERTRVMGVEELWNISFAAYTPSLEAFQLYSIDLLQDRSDVLLSESDGIVTVDPRLMQALNYSTGNAAWYVLRDLDERFPSIHPVHVTKALLSPYTGGDLQGSDSLPACKAISDEDGDATFIRLTRASALSSGQEVIDGNLRQIVPREDRIEEYIACPARYSARLSRTILGDNVRIIEYR